MAKLFFFDLETTGADPNIHGIHQIAGGIEIDGVSHGAFNYKVRPFDNDVIDPKALEVAKVTEFQIKSYPSPQQVFGKLLSKLNSHVDQYNKQDKFFMVGWNSKAFDNPFLKKFFEKNGNMFFGAYFWPNGIDVMELASLHLADQRPKMENFKLGTVAKELLFEFNDAEAHDGLYDVKITKQIFHAVTKKV